MDVYSAENIRNIVLLGHGGVGKTTIAEQMAFITKATTRLGKVTDKNTVSDFDQEEMKRGFSINTSLILKRRFLSRFGTKAIVSKAFCNALR